MRAPFHDSTVDASQLNETAGQGPKPDDDLDGAAVRVGNGVQDGATRATQDFSVTFASTATGTTNQATSTKATGARSKTLSTIQSSCVRSPSTGPLTSTPASLPSVPIRNGSTLSQVSLLSFLGVNTLTYEVLKSCPYYCRTVRRSTPR